MDVRREVRQASALAVLSGAGVSVGSSLPTYRGPSGLYSSGGFPPLHVRDLKAARLPRMWQHVHALKAAVDAAVPAPAHEALARFAASRPVTVVTQNVDGLHQRAGSPVVHELHGTLSRVRCTGFNHVHPWGVQVDDQGVPRCPTCAGRCRPDVVLFGERLNDTVRAAAWAAVASADVLIVVGTSLEVSPACDLVAHGQLHGARVVHVNVAPSRIPGVVDLVGPADEVLVDLLGV